MDQQGFPNAQVPQAEPVKKIEYEVGSSGHYGECSAIAHSGRGPNPEMFNGAWQNINQGLHGIYTTILSTYWQAQIGRLETEEHDYKVHQLPLARIKKVMKADPEVKMISAEAPILFAKGCDIFITELTMRAWIHAEENKRRTLQRSDIASALTKSDMFDFLIDIVPRDDAVGTKRAAGNNASGTAAAQQSMQAPAAHPQAHHPGQQEYPGHYPQMAEQDYRHPQMYVGAPGGDPTYGHPPPQMFDPSQGMYATHPYQIPAQQVRQL